MRRRRKCRSITRGRGGKEREERKARGRVGRGRVSGGRGKG